MRLDRRECDGLLGTDMETQRRLWRFQRAGWIAMSLVLILALAGLFGTGPLSRTTRTADAGAVSVEYDRFIRYDSPTRLRVHAPLETDTTVRVFLSQEYLDRVLVTNVTPHPDAVTVQSDGAVYRFHATTSGRAITVIFDIKSDTIGPLSGTIGIPERSLMTIQQFSYP